MIVGPAIIVAILVVALPVVVLVSGAVASALLGTLLTHEVEQLHEGSELIDLGG